MERILNLCDIGFRLKDRMPARELICEMGGIDRVYIGSYFCEQYFLKTSLPVLEWCAAYCRSQGIRMACVVPIPSQRYLDSCKKHLELLKEQYPDLLDMVCVNDPGMLQWAAGRFEKTVLGRLFQKRIRDPRYAETSGNGAFSVSREMRERIGQYRIWGIEIEGIFGSVGKTDRDFCIYSHVGLCYMSCMRECLYASLYRELPARFRTDTECGVECSRYRMKNKIQGGHEIFRIGKGIYFQTGMGTSAPDGADGVILYPQERW